jgi:CBS domain-containing protein
MKWPHYPNSQFARLCPTKKAKYVTSSRRPLREVMTRNVKTVSPTAAVHEAANLMKTLDVGAIPVCNGERLEGMVTDRDIVVRVVAENRDPKNAKVQEAMTKKIVYGYEDQDIQEAARMMQESQIRRLPVINREKQLVGIVSLGDLAVKPESPDIGGKTLKEISQPDKPQR